MVTRKQRADHFTPMMWFDTINWRFHFIGGQFHYCECIKYYQKYMIQNRISSETHKWYVYAMWSKDRTPKSTFYTDDFPRRSGRSKYFAYLGTYMLLMAQLVVSLSLYNRANDCLLKPGWDESSTVNRSNLKMYVRNRWSPIHICHRFAFKLHILHKSDNLLHYEIAYRCDKPDSVQF